MIYLATSWRNRYFEGVVDCFEQWNIPFYNFKDNGFNFKHIDPLWYAWSRQGYISGLNHQLARDGFAKDHKALIDCDGLLLITPCGRSAHLELGFATGFGKPTAIYLTEKQEPELMYKLADDIYIEIDGVMNWASQKVLPK